MKAAYFFLFLVMQTSVYAQIDNKLYNQKSNQSYGNYENEIAGDHYNLTIITKVIYNAVPDGYHITYTTSFIGNSIEDVESRMNKKMDSLVQKVSSLKLSHRDVTVDVIALDPIFDFRQNDSVPPIGYKVTENITFNVRNIGIIKQLTSICLEFGIYDMINAQAYLLNAKPIYDSLDAKTVELLNAKKKLCEDVGISLKGGKVSIVKFKETFYPDERYLKSYLTNATIYKHHMTQNSTLNMERTVDVDNYYDLNLKDADFVFNAGNDNPVIQLYYKLVYTWNHVDTEAEIREKILKELEEKDEKEIYILDKEGSLQKVTF